MRRLLVIAGAVTAGVIPVGWGRLPDASAAGVATLEYSLSLLHTDNTLVYRARDPLDHTLSLGGTGDWSGRFQFTDPGVLMTNVTNVWAAPAPVPVPSVGCTTGLGSSVCGRQVGGISIVQSDGNDSVRIRASLGDWYYVGVKCGGGNDVVYAYHSRVSVASDCEKVIR